MFIDTCLISRCIGMRHTFVLGIDNGPTTCQQDTYTTGSHDASVA